MYWRAWEDKVLTEYRFFSHDELKTLFLPHRTEEAIRKRRARLDLPYLTHCRICEVVIPVNNSYQLCPAHYRREVDKRESLPFKYTEYKKGATARNIRWELDLIDFAEHWNSHCAYCNDKIAGIGLDRVDSGKHYTKDNVVPCCTTCNGMKSGLDLDHWMDQVNKIYEARDGDSRKSKSEDSARNDV